MKPAFIGLMKGIESLLFQFPNIRLRSTILAIQPNMWLEALAYPQGLTLCDYKWKEIWRPSWLDPWASLSDTDYNTDNWPAYTDAAPNIVSGFHWNDLIQ